jgi:hypothetical protein
VLLGNGNGTFQSPTVYQLGDIGDGSDVAIGDLNGDGKPDVLASGLGGIGVLLGSGSPGGRLRFVGAEDQAPIGSIALRDLNNDHRLDVVLGGNGLRVRLGNGNGTFGAPTELLDVGISSVAIGDFNLDRKADVIAAHFPEALTVFLGNGDGTFKPPQSFNPGPDDGPVAVGRLNNDRYPDVVVGNQEFASVSVLINDGDWSGRSGGRGSGIVVQGGSPRADVLEPSVIALSTRGGSSAGQDLATRSGSDAPGAKSMLTRASAVSADDVLAIELSGLMEAMFRGLDVGV